MTSSKTKRKPKPIRATWDGPDTPEWGPLVNQVGPFLARWFMYMGTARLEDGGRVHAYKHIDTRRYLHIHDDLRCFVDEGDDRLLEVRRCPAVFTVFGDISYYPSEQEEFEVYRAAVLVAEHLASLRDEDPESEPPPEKWTATEADAA